MIRVGPGVWRCPDTECGFEHFDQDESEDQPWGFPTGSEKMDEPITAETIKDWTIILSGARTFLGRITQTHTEAAQVTLCPAYELDEAKLTVRQDNDFGTLRNPDCVPFFAFCGPVTLRLRVDGELRCVDLDGNDRDYLVALVRRAEDIRGRLREQRSPIARATPADVPQGPLVVPGRP